MFLFNSFGSPSAGIFHSYPFLPCPQLHWPRPREGKKLVTPLSDENQGFPGFPAKIKEIHPINFNCICIQSLSNIHVKLPNIGLSQVYHRQFPHCRLLSLRVAARGGWRWVKYSVVIQHSYGTGFMFRSFDDLPIKNMMIFKFIT